MQVQSNGIAIEVEDSAAQDSAQRGRPAVLLIMGLGMQLTVWPPEMVQALVNSGFRVIRMDNRDVGLSTHFDAMGVPNLLWAGLKFQFGFAPHAAYSVSDMANDALGVLDALDIAQAHVVGVSLGGMIAQRVAIAAPQRTLSLTSIMSSSGARHLPQPDSAVMRLMFSRPQGHGLQAAVDHMVRLLQAIGSPAYPTPQAELRERVQQAAQRSFHPVGTVRQMVAVAADMTRADELARITSPTLVIHGKEDPLVPYACGVDTASRIAGATLVGIEGMGHDLPPEPVAQILTVLIDHLRRAHPNTSPSSGVSA
jgi:pimeloyl-ACP methyl ester carboxylesterase